METTNLVSELERLWVATLHSIVLVRGTKDGRRAGYLVHELDGLRLFVAIFIGKRGSLTEWVCVIDSTQANPANKLIFGCVTRSGGVIVRLKDMREEVGAGGNIELICRLHLQAELNEMLRGSAQYAKYLRTLNETYHPRSAIRGEIPEFPLGR